MKIGILTFHYAHNFGATLQAYALKTYVEKMGHEVIIVNYRNPQIEKQYPRRLAPKFAIEKLRPKNFKQYVYDTLRGIYGQKQWAAQWDAFDTFINEKLLENCRERVTAENISSLKRDAYLLGSDQIWSSFLFFGELDPVYFGSFKQNEKMISYAASLPNAKIPEPEREDFKRLLKNVDVLSVREEKLAEEITALTGREVRTTIDPTLLLEAKDYDCIISPGEKLPHPIPKKPYVFAYFVVEEAAVAKTAEKIAREKGLELIELHYFHMPECSEKNQYADFGPGDFLAYIKNAEYVVTNSFHGTVFSIIFGRKFYSVYQKNGRVDNLLGFLRIPERHVTGAEELGEQLAETELNYEEINKKLEEYRKDSIRFLQDNL